MAADYIHGKMDIDEQQKTFALFMRMTVWSSALTAVSLVFLTLHFAIGVDWFTSLGLAFVLGILIGLGLGLKSAWYGALVVCGVLVGAIGVLTAIVGALSG